MIRRIVIGWLGFCALVPVAALGQIVIPGANGSDGALVIPGGTLVTKDLALADTQPDWESQPNPNPGEGVYDPNRWAVIYRYTSVTVNSNARVAFSNHPSRAPVLWLVSGNVTIDSGSIVDLNGGIFVGCAPSEPAPGGFRGAQGGTGTGQPPGDGFGPGGGTRVFGVGQSGGSFGGIGASYPDGSRPAPPLYGSVFLLPLIGGSGGAALYNTQGSCTGGMAGGGAILIAATGTITVNGTIRANGGDRNDIGAAAGSGGAVRLLADQVVGSGTLSARGGDGWGTSDGGAGRIAVNANLINLTTASNPPYNAFVPVSDPVLLFPPAAAPQVRATTLVAGGQTYNFPADPRGQFSFPSSDLAFDTNDPVTVNIAAQNVPLDWVVTVRITPRSGPSLTVTADPLQGSLGSSTTSATIANPPRGFGAIQVRAHRP